MARFETQINQIYLTHPEAKNVSLILYEESLGSAHLFLLAELSGLQKKSEAQSLKKISEIILASFRANKKLGAEEMFEASLSQINQNLADLAHAGHKSWVGKFSAMITLKSADNIYLANNGQTCAYLKRKTELLEILPTEKRGTHPLKSFQNFSQGKLQTDDGLLLLTSNIFNYISFPLFTKILSQLDLAGACEETTKILQESVDDEHAFCAFFIGFPKKSAEAAQPAMVPEISSYVPEPEDTDLPPKRTAAGVSAMMLEKLKAVPGSLPKFSWPAWNFSNLDLSRAKTALNPSRVKNWHWPKWQFEFFRKLTLAGKFFFISFGIFLILFVVNLSIYGFKLRTQRIQDKITNQVTLINNDISAIQSALIYQDNDQALKLYATAEQDFNTLKTMDMSRTAEFIPKLAQLYNQVNKTSVASDPKVYGQFTEHPVYLARTPDVFLLAGLDSNSVSTFDGTTDTNYFLLNSLKENITSIASWAPVGPVIATSTDLYRIDDTLKQYVSFDSIPGAQIDRIKTYNSNLYALDTKNGKIYRITASNGKFTTQVAATGDFSGARDFAVNKDIYVLFADHIEKVAGSTNQAFPMPFMTDPLSNGTRIFVASNIYILEANKKRVIIVSPTGVLVNQISFPTTNTPLDLFVDEASRSLFLLDDNVMYRITF